LNPPLDFALPDLLLLLEVRESLDEELLRAKAERRLAAGADKTLRLPLPLPVLIRRLDSRVMLVREALDETLDNLPLLKEFFEEDGMPESLSSSSSSEASS
jgi:hypothetical protein